jgi:hypothetical protein
MRASSPALQAAPAPGLHARAGRLRRAVRPGRGTPAARLRLRRRPLPRSGARAGVRRRRRRSGAGRRRGGPPARACGVARRARGRAGARDRRLRRHHAVVGPRPSPPAGRGPRPAARAARAGRRAADLHGQRELAAVEGLRTPVGRLHRQPPRVLLTHHLPALARAAGFATVVPRPQYPRSVERGTSSLSARRERRVRRAVERGNQGPLLRAAAFADGDGPARWNRRS